MKEQMKKAFDLAQNEVEEKEIAHLKGIIKNLLEEKKRLETNRDEIEEKIKVIKQDIDDFKSGRLDKVKERHDTNPYANVVAPIHITIINDNSRKIYPQKPWLWNYDIVWCDGYVLTDRIGATTTNAVYTCSGTPLTAGTSGTTVTLCGTASATFAGGTYSLSDGSITNL